MGHKLLKLALCFSAVLALATGAWPQASPITYIYDPGGKLVGVVNASGDTVVYNYDAVGNLLSISRYPSTQVSIINFTPGSGPVGASVTINGTGFSTTPSQNTVTFNGTTATVTTSSATRIVTSVPAGATSGPISVTAPAGSATSSSSFTVTASGGAPTITGFSPNIGVVGTPVTVSGTNFSTTGANNRTKFNLTLATVSSATATSIATSVPPTVASGRISLATPLGTTVSPGDFYVPPFSYGAADVGLTSRMTIGSGSTVMIGTAGNIGLVLFDATQGQRVNLQASSGTFGGCDLNISILSPYGTTLAGPQGFMGCSGVLYGPVLPFSGTYTILLVPGSRSTGTVTLSLINLPSTPPPSRPAGAVLDLSNSLSTSLVGLFLMNEGSGPTDKNLANIQNPGATFSGAITPTWSTIGSPSVQFNGGGSLNSYLDAGLDPGLDQLQVSRTTVVAKIYLTERSRGGIVERNDGGGTFQHSGFAFGVDSNGALALTVQRDNMTQVRTNGGVVPVGQWVQVAFTWDGNVALASAAHLFLNGVEQPKAFSQDGWGGIGTDTANRPFRIGNASYNFAGALTDPGGSLFGRIAYVAVYKGRILTAAEMNQLDMQLPIR